MSLELNRNTVAALFVVVLGSVVPCRSNEPEAIRFAQKHTLPARETERSKKSGEVRPDEPNNAGFTNWPHLAVNYSGGSRIAARGSAAQVYIRGLKWHYAEDSAAIISPAGNELEAGDGWQYPDATQFGVVLYQTNGNYWQITGTSADTATRIRDLDPSLPIYLAVNDKRRDYDDNWGAFNAVLIVE